MISYPLPLKCKNMAEQDIKENEMTTVSSVDYVRGLKGKDSVLIKKSDLLSSVLKRMSLPRYATNEIGNYDDLDSGYGYYDNTYDTSGQYAPAQTSGIFIRFKVDYDDSSITLFLPIMVGERKLWYRKKGGVCTVFGQ